MTKQTPPNPPGRSNPNAPTSRRRPSLHRTVLSLVIAAVVAAWLPFSMFYITALNKRVTNVSAISAPRLDHWHGPRGHHGIGCHTVSRRQ